jgi:hypothetical protein
MTSPVFFFSDPLSAWAFAALRAGMGADRGGQVEVFLPEGVEALPLWALPAFYEFPAGEAAWVWAPGGDLGPIPLRPLAERPRSIDEVVLRLERALGEERKIRVPPAAWGMLPGFPEGEPPLAVAAEALGALVRAEGEAVLLLAALALREEAARRPELSAVLEALGRPLRPVRLPAPRPLPGHPVVILLERGREQEFRGAFRSLGRAPEGLERHEEALRAALRRRLGSWFLSDEEWARLTSPDSPALRAAADRLSPEDLLGVVPEDWGVSMPLRRAVARALGLAGRLPPEIAREALGEEARWAELAWRIRHGDRSELHLLGFLHGWEKTALQALARQVFPDWRPPRRKPLPPPSRSLTREDLLDAASREPAERPPRAVREAARIRPDPKGDPYLALALGRLQGPEALRAVAARLPEELPPPSSLEAEAAAAAVADLAADPEGRPLARRLLERLGPDARGRPRNFVSKLAERPTLPPALGPLLWQAWQPWTWEKAAWLLTRLPELEEGRALLEELASDPPPERLVILAAWAGLAVGVPRVLVILPSFLDWGAPILPERPWRLHPDARLALPVLAEAARGWRIPSLLLALAGWLGRADLAEEAFRRMRGGSRENIWALREALPRDLPAWLRARLAGQVRRLLAWGGGEEPAALLALAEDLGLHEEAQAFRSRWPFCGRD